MPATIAVIESLDEWGEVLAYEELTVYRGSAAARDAGLLRLGYRRTGSWAPGPYPGEWVCTVEQAPQPDTSTSSNDPAGGTNQ